MSDALSLSTPVDPASARPAMLDRLARRVLLNRLARLQIGRIALLDGADRLVFGNEATEAGLSATVTVHGPGAYRRIALRGTVGAGEAFMAGEWSCDDLTALMRIMVRNRHVFLALEGGAARAAQAAFRLLHALRANSRRGSRSNIAAHYDLGNDFFALFLDETMSYSSGVFERPDSTLAEAATAKLERVCRKLALSPGDHVLEIGGGWGGFALHAAGRYGCRVTTTTISRQQFELARRLIDRSGLGDRITLLQTDYRDLTGSFDKLVSIEMVEAVGHRNFDDYFAACARLLKPDGLMLLQTITIADQFYDAALRAVDFIQRYIFPGSCLPSVTAICRSLTRATDLRLVQLEDLTAHYARTLHCWRDNFRTNLDVVRAMGYDDRFIRMWEFYLCYCEGGFLERNIGDVQMVLAKPMCRAEPVLLPQA